MANNTFNPLGVESAIVLQKKLIDLPEDPQELINFFNNSTVLLKAPKCFATEFINVVKIRPGQILQYAQIISGILKAQSAINPQFQQIFLDECFNVTTDMQTECYSNVFHLVRYCYELGAFQISEIRTKLINFPLQNKQTLFLAFCFFAHYLELFDSSLTQMLEYKITKLDYNISIKTMISQFSAFKQENWKQMMVITEYGFEYDSVGRAIKYDDLSTLQQIIQFSENFSQQRINLNIFSTILARYQVSPLQLAAFYSSILCFKFLSLNSHEFIEISPFAVAGGDPQIVQLCKEKCEMNIPWCLHSATQFRQYDILQWIFNNFDISEIELREVFCLCGTFGNIVSLQWILSNNPTIDVNLLNQRGNSCLHEAVANNHLIMVYFLVKYVKCSLNTTNWRGESPLQLSNDEQMKKLFINLIS